jgi:hypothetical protein
VNHDVRGCRVCFDRFADRKATGIGQLDIEQNETWFRLSDNSQGIGAGLGLDHLISALLQYAALGVPSRFVIIYVENSGSWETHRRHESYMNPGMLVNRF